MEVRLLLGSAMSSIQRPWKLAYQKLFYFQKKIQSSTNARSLRNFQRCLHRNSLIQLLVVHRSMIESPKFRKVHRNQLAFELLSQLWVLSLWPTQPNIKFLQDSQIYKTLCLVCQKPNVQYIFIRQYPNFLSPKIKYWILSSLFIEKKFFLTWLKFKPHNLSLKKIFFLEYFRSDKFQIFEYNNFIFIPLNALASFENGCSFYSLKKGFHFLGWFFKKESFFYVEISHKNLRNHQKELKFLLKTSKDQPADQVLYRLNRKILRWQKFYYPLKFSMVRRYFRLIWPWIQKRHRNKDSKWLYTHYMKNWDMAKW